MKKIFLSLVILSFISCAQKPDGKISSDTAIIPGKPIDSLVKIQLVREDSFAGKPVSFYLQNPKLPPVAKRMYTVYVEPNNNDTAFSFMDSLFAKESDLAPYYFLIVTKTMERADGAYSEGVGMEAKAFAEAHTPVFLNYFTNEPLLSEKDFSNWTKCVIGEIRISAEHKEATALEETIKLMKNNSASCTAEEKKTLDKFILLLRKQLVIYTSR